MYIIIYMSLSGKCMINLNICQHKLIQRRINVYNNLNEFEQKIWIYQTILGLIID